jgi:protein O-mannosyl-transferase
MSRRSKARIAREQTPPTSKGRISSTQFQSTDRWPTVAVCGFLAVAVWVVFGQTLNHGFVNYDDNVYVYENPAVSQGLSWSGIAWAFSHSLSWNWHPITVLSHMLDCQFYGLNPSAHHLTNVLLHAATVIMLFLVLKSMMGFRAAAPAMQTRVFWQSTFVAAVFAIHPLRVESVAWVSERKDVLSGLFFMLTLWAYYQYVLRLIAHSPKSKVWYGLALGLFALGLMSKPMLVTLPFVLLLLDYWPLKRIPDFHLRFAVLKPLVVEKIPFLLLTVAACMGAVLAQKGAIVSVDKLALTWRIRNALTACAVYIEQMVYPFGLAVFYPHPENHLAAWKVCVSMLLLALITVGVLAGRRKHPYLLVGWLWYLGMLVPVLGIMQVGSQAHADRYTYLPQIGLLILVAWGLSELCGGWRYRRAVLGYAAAATLAGLLVVAYIQTGFWKNSLTLWTHTLDCTSGNSIAHNNLGNALADQGKTAEAIQHYQQALEIKPDAQAHFNWGTTLAEQGKLADAVPHFEQALQLDPNYAKAHNNFGNVLAAQRRFAESVPHYQRALELNPDNIEARFNLGNVLADQGKVTDAMPHFHQALNLAIAQNKSALVDRIRARINLVSSTRPMP